jgi:histone-lysine N-methyltransferase SETD3
VYDSYGKKCNSRFLLNYGFTIEDNDANEYPVTLKLDDSCPLFEEKKKLFKKEQEMIKKFRISENIVDYSVIDFFSYLRFILFDGEIEILLKIISDNRKIVFEEVMPSFYLISPINMQQEIKVLQKIRDIMKEYLNLYKSKLQEDEEIINSINNERQSLTHNQRNCIIMRISEKKVLHFYLNFAEYCLELFEMTVNVIKIFKLFTFN